MLFRSGRHHLLEHVHPIGKKKPFDLLFNVGPLMMNGGLETVNNLSFPLSSEGDYRISFGPAMRTIIDLARPENGISTLPTGQSGHVLSEHYSDQTHLHVQGKYRPMLMNEKSIKQFREPLMLLPAGK